MAEKEGRLCVRFYQRKDGTMITRDCPVGVRIARRRFVAALSWAASLAVASITGALRPAGAANASKASPPPAVVASMGDIAAPVKPHSPTPKPKPAVKPKAPKIPLKPMMGKIAMPPPRKPAPTALMGAAMPPPPSTKSGQ
ncbi:hypothetical protein [Capsulimonas corticalis]|uniref:hypothetical protein n=1 Tax=Capsulimonas corticalis TaxID=2219043 RepID=UPI0026226491|nr:hypothetical protein [Capsulimonas corticalis]